MEKCHVVVRVLHRAVGKARTFRPTPVVFYPVKSVQSRLSNKEHSDVAQFPFCEGKFSFVST